MKKYLAIILSAMMVFTCFAFTGCGANESTEEAAEAAEEAVEEKAEAAEDAAEDTAKAAEPYSHDWAEDGYAGKDPIEAEVFEYIGDEIAERYMDDDEGESIPVVSVIATDTSNPNDILVWGDFWVFNYKIEGDTLKMVSGGAHPGLIHLAKDDDDEYDVVKLEEVADGSEYEPSAKKIFGDHYDAFAKVNSDNEAREKLRAQIIAVYVKANGLSVTKYQDEGSDPIDIPL